MKITFILSSYPSVPVGGGRVIYEYADNLVARGHYVTIVHPQRLTNWDPVDHSVPFHKLRKAALTLRDALWKPRINWQYIDPRIDIRYVATLKQDCLPDADIIIATWWATAEIVSQCPESKGNKVHLIQSYETWGGPKERVDAVWRAPILKVVIAQWLFDKGIELEVPIEQMILIPNGINHGIYSCRSPIELRSKRVAMMYGELPLKGGADGLKALDLAKEKFPLLEAVLFGTGPRPNGLAKWIAYYRNPPQDFLVQNIYNSCSIYLCPSWLEGWALPPAEAMSCGCALVSTDIGGVHDYAKQGQTALLSEPRNYQALGMNLLRLLEDDSLRAEVAHNGYALVQQFTWEKSAGALEQKLMDVVA